MSASSGIECHLHPGKPGVAYCVRCHTFMCRDCTALTSPHVCPACIAGMASSWRSQLTRPLYVCLLVGIAAAVMIVLLATVYDRWPWSPFTSLPIGYYAASVYLTWRFAQRTLTQTDLVSVLIALFAGPIALPAIVIHRLYWLRRVRIIRTEADRLIATGHGAPPSPIQLDDTLYPGSQPVSF
jgi:hypothetical protein